ncbi:MAG: hypothetical protein JNJ70_05280 [Verrucomicrobiales bacterium]|nr:hypothetical protein [Verrucomicrobiales bacterium]
MEPENPSRFPHPSVIAIREALKKRPPATVERIEEQIREAQAWHRRQTEGGSVDARPTSRLPHPDDLAARVALAKKPPASLEQVMIQAKASEEWRKRQSDGKSDS